MNRSGAVVDDGESGLPAPSGYAEGISDAILRLLRGPTLRAEMGRRSGASVAERFSADRMGEEIAELFGELLAGSERPAPDAERRSCRAPGAAGTLMVRHRQQGRVSA